MPVVSHKNFPISLVYNLFLIGSFFFLLKKVTSLHYNFPDSYKLVEFVNLLEVKFIHKLCFVYPLKLSSSSLDCVYLLIFINYKA